MHDLITALSQLAPAGAAAAAVTAAALTVRLTWRRGRPANRP